MTEERLILDGRSLTLEALARSASGYSAIGCAPEALSRMADTRRLLDAAAIAGQPIYGVTRALGARSGEDLRGDPRDIALATIRGRAHAVGPFERTDVVRSSMIVRLNTLLSGHAGARPEVATHLLGCLNAGLTPEVRSIGSIGASDLTVNASLTLALIGEGQMRDAQGRTGPGREMMLQHGLSPLVPEGRDGLALIGHSSLTVAASALAIRSAAAAFEAAQTAAALSFEGFRASLVPLEAAVLAVKPLPGQALAAEGLIRRLSGSRLLRAGEARRLQDPLSFRNLAQIHGVAASALEQARHILHIELNGSSDNPAVLPDQGRVVTSGAYFNAELAHAVESLSRSFVAVGFAQLARMAKHLDPDFSGLPPFLGEEGSNGFAPVMKTAEAVAAELVHAAQPPPLWPSINANGVEDCLSSAAVAARLLQCVADHASRLAAMELIIAARAVALRQLQDAIAPPLHEILALVQQATGGGAPGSPAGDAIERLASHCARWPWTSPQLPST